MGFNYLHGKCWADISREERFFCQHLFTLAVDDCANGRAIRVLSRIRNHEGNGLADDVQWRPAFEVCFYRDLLHSRRKDNPGYSFEHSYSPKRTFDLVFFSENAILILEAKAQQGFKGSQLKDFCEDRKSVQCLTGVSDVWIYGLASSRYIPRRKTIESFEGPLLTWHDLAKAYDGDEVLRRADCIYGD